MQRDEYRLFKLKTRLKELLKTKSLLVHNEPFYLFNAQSTNYFKAKIDYKMREAF